MCAAGAARCGATALAMLAGSGVMLLASPAAAGQPSTPPTGARELYQNTCAACHGPDGRGVEASRLGLATPDFTDCSFATPEPDVDWLAVTHGGGPARGFDPRMPAFGAGLSDRTRAIHWDTVKTVALAWIVTLPAAALIAAVSWAALDFGSRSAQRYAM